MSEEKKPTIPQRLVGWFKDGLDWGKTTLTDDDLRTALYDDIGLKPADQEDLKKLKEIPDGRLDSIERYRKMSKPDHAAYMSAVQDLTVVYKAMKEIIEGRNDPGGNGKFAHRIFEVMTLNHLRLNYPILYWLGQPLGFIEESISTLAPGKTYPERFKTFFAAPIDHFHSIGWPPENEAEAQALSDFTLGPLGAALIFWEKTLLKIPKIGQFLPNLKTEDIIYGWDSFQNSKTPVADRIANRALTFSYGAANTDNSSGNDHAGSINFTLLWVPRDHGGPGLLVAFGGSGQAVIPIGRGWELRMEQKASSFVDFLIGNEPIFNGPEDASIKFTLEHPPDPSGGPNIWGASNGTRLEFDHLSLSGEFSARLAELQAGLKTGCKAGIKFAAHKSAVVIAGKDGDGFIAKILPDNDTRIDFDLGLGLSTDRGFYVEGGAGFQALIPISKTLGPLTIHHILLSLQAITDPKPAKIAAEVSAAIGIKLGPVEGTIEQIGVRSELLLHDTDWPDLSDLSFGFKPPKGVGLAINAKGISGGGYLFFDHEKEQYAGIVQLEFEEKFSLKAIGLLTTRLPDGSKGFSLLLMISVEDFTPINIGMGFTLNGVGGLLGVNRSVAVDVLRSGLKNGSLNAVLFPEDPIRNAPQIISNLRSVFPPTKNQYVFGLMAKIGWGTPTLLTLDLGIVLEFPSPLRLLILGQLRALLPSTNKALIKLQMDAIGVVDFDKGEAALDAVIYDSKMLQFGMTGDMALRTRWEQDPTFLLSVGGFNPKFTPPEGFPKLTRVAMNITKGKNPRIRLAAYMALTSNTVQFGARADLYFKISSFTIQGHLSFDALFIFSPFSFITDFSAGVSVKWKKYNLAGIHLQATLAGPSPWHIQGKASFSVWIFDKTVSVDKTFGSKEQPALPPPVDPLPRLQQALSDKRNWKADLPTQKNMAVSLREIPSSTDVLVHPLGSLAVSQVVVPLNITITKFGNTRPKGTTQFSISQVMVDGTTTEDTDPVKEHFSPAEFLEMTDQQKLSSPSFEKMESGLRIGTENVTFFSDLIETDLAYETSLIVEKDRETQKTKLEKMPVDIMKRLVSLGAAGRSVRRKRGKKKFGAPGRKMTLKKADFVVASTADLTIREDVHGLNSSKPATFTEAKDAMQKFLAEHPKELGRVQVIRRPAATSLIGGEKP